jgi:hypothetical protein
MMASHPELERFGQLLMSHVRDQAIVAADRLAQGQMVGPDGDRWRALLSNEISRSAVIELIPDIVDQVLFALLNAVDNDHLPLGWRQHDGTFAALEELGQREMGGWLMGDGWHGRYSSQRYFDPHPDLRLELDDDS